MAKIRFNGATSGRNLLATYGYDDLGRRTSLARGNGTTTGYQYDPVSRLSQMIHNLGGAATAHDLTLGFAYNPASQITSTTRSNNLYAWTKHGSGTTSTSANGRNQLASWNAPLTYDAKGNLTSDGTNAFAYSSENLLTSLTVPPWGTAALTYDPLMRFAASGGQRFLSFADELIAEYYQGGLVSRFVPGADFAETAARLNGSGVRSWYYADERGSTLAVAGDAGSASQILAYDEYGRPGATPPPRIGYTGQLMLSFGLLYDYRNRMYHAGLGRFLQPDPNGYGSGMNLYAYVGGDPVNRHDPFGLAGSPPPPPPDNQDIIITGRRKPKSYCDEGFVQIGNVCVDRVDLTSVIMTAHTVTFTTLGSPDIGPGVDCTAQGNTVTCKLDSDPPQCPAGNYGQLTISAGINLSFISPGASLSVALTYSKPGGGGWRGSQVALTGQATGTLGLGAYAGAGLAGGMNIASAPMRTGTNSSRYFEAEAGWGPAGGFSILFPDDDDSHASGSLGIPKAGPGVGFGAYAGYGRAWSATYATPPLGCR